MSLPHISVCICTFKRPVMLRRLLEALGTQVTGGFFNYSIVVVDNDDSLAGRDVVGEFAAKSQVPVSYHLENRRNIALARNKSIAHALGDYIAFIDDDEFPVNDWLVRLFQACRKFGASAVLGPVRPHFECTPPAWVVRGRFCERPEFPTGTVIPWSGCRTGNVLFPRAILPLGEEPFCEQFGTGGEDKDFFMRMSQSGHNFVWCNEAVVFETVPENRLTRRYMLSRALLRGENSLKLTQGRLKLLIKSLVAVPVYSALLPFTIFLGQHRSMDTCIRLCDHLGRVFTVLGLRRVTERQM